MIACCAVAIVVPPMIGNFGLGLKSGGPLGVMPSSDGLALQRTYVGEIAAIDKICQSIPPNSSVLIADLMMMAVRRGHQGDVRRAGGGRADRVPNANTAPGGNASPATCSPTCAPSRRPDGTPSFSRPPASELSPLGNGQ